MRAGGLFWLASDRALRRPLQESLINTRAPLSSNDGGGEEEGDLAAVRAKNNSRSGGTGHRLGWYGFGSHLSFDEGLTRREHWRRLTTGGGHF